MCWQLAGSLAVELDSTVIAGPVEMDDRRWVFQVATSDGQKVVIVQAENERERDEVYHQTMWWYFAEHYHETFNCIKLHSKVNYEKDKAGNIKH